MSFIISICIPTYNRCNYLDTLLENLFEIMTLYGEYIEVCISDNCSSDRTIEVIDMWKLKYNINYVSQNYNTGASENIKEVIKLANGKYTLLLGDDDGIEIDQFSHLVNQLKSEEIFFWNVGINMLKKSNDDFLIHDIGTYKKNEFISVLERKGLIFMGFIGKHIIPTYIIKEILNLETSQIRPWPHLHLYFSTFNSIETRILPFSFYKQAVRGSQLFWESKDGLNIILAFHKIFSSDCVIKEYDLLRKKELTRFYLFSLFVMYFLTDNVSFSKNAIYEYCKVLKKNDYNELNIIFFLNILRLLSFFSPIFRPFFKYLPIVKRYHKIHLQSLELSGFKRGI